jgi:L-asparaginase
MSAISLFTTGGTLDKQYNELKGQLGFVTTSIHKIIKNSRTTLDIDIEELMLIDSLEMSKTQREQIVTACLSSKNKNIIITHGTDTMVETAKEIAHENLDKTIILTGAMIPYNIQKSDAVFNISSAIAFCQVLEKGVYIVMNGHYFLWNDVKKNKELGHFENL